MVDLVSDWSSRLRKKITCPNCWHSFGPDELLFIARHIDLIGDDVAGPDEYRRFNPVRFTPEGDAIDPRGVSTSDLACPRCHLKIDPVYLEMPPFFVSLVGSPASGKTYYLTSLAWQLRQLMPRFGYSFSDADPLANSLIHEYEQQLFLNPQPDRPTAILKTSPQDARHHRFVRLNDMSLRLPTPLQFIMSPKEDSQSMGDNGGWGLVFYDNAGEDCRPSADISSSAVVQHLAMSKIIMMLIDLTQDPRFALKIKSDDPQLVYGLRPDREGGVVDRQETILKEAGKRLRRYLRISEKDKLNKALVMAIPKFDIMKEFMGISIDEEPFGRDGEGRLRLDMDRIELTSRRIREILWEFSPDVVTTAENISNKVVYIPVSSLGRSPEYVSGAKGQGFYGIRPGDIRPQWVTVPLLYCLSKWTRAMARLRLRRENG